MRQSNWRGQVGISGVIPRVPRNDANYSQPWSHFQTRDFFGSFSAEYDLADNAMIYAKVGERDGKEDQVSSGIAVLDAMTVAADCSASFVPRTDNNDSATTGLRVKLNGAGFSHEVNVGVPPAGRPTAMPTISCMPIRALLRFTRLTFMTRRR